MLRSLASRGLKAAASRSNTIVCRQNRLFSSNRVVRQESPPGFTPEQAQQLAQTPLVQKISKSPKALQQMTKTMDLFVERGYVKPGESPGLMTHFKILTDSKIREQLSEMKKTFDAEGIVITKEDAEQLMSLMVFKQDEARCEK